MIIFGTHIFISSGHYYIICIQASHVGHFIMVDKLLSSRKSVASTSNNEELGQNTLKGMAIMVLERF